MIVMTFNAPRICTLLYLQMPVTNHAPSLSSIVTSFNPAGDQEKSSVAYCSNKNHIFAKIGHKNMNDASF